MGKKKTENRREVYTNKRKKTEEEKKRGINGKNCLELMHFNNVGIINGSDKNLRSVYNYNVCSIILLLYSQTHLYWWHGILVFACVKIKNR